MLDLSPGFLSRLRAMSEAACASPWVRWESLPCVGVDTADCTVIHGECSTGFIGPHTKANHELIVAMRNSFSSLLDEIEQLRSRVKELEAPA